MWCYDSRVPYLPAGSNQPSGGLGEGEKYGAEGVELHKNEISRAKNTESEIREKFFAHHLLTKKKKCTRGFQGQMKKVQWGNN